MQRMKRLKHHPQVLDVLSVVMNYSNADVLPSIMDVVNRVSYLFFNQDYEPKINAKIFS